MSLPCLFLCTSCNTKGKIIHPLRRFVNTGIFQSSKINTTINPATVSWPRIVRPLHAPCCRENLVYNTAERLCAHLACQTHTQYYRISSYATTAYFTSSRCYMVSFSWLCSKYSRKWTFYEPKASATNLLGAPSASAIVCVSWPNAGSIRCASDRRHTKTRDV